MRQEHRNIEDRKIQRERLRDDDNQTARCSLEIVTGVQNLATLSPTDLFDRERPEDLKATFKLSRNWHKQTWFVDQANAALGGMG